jgi:hypothetical protein
VKKLNIANVFKSSNEDLKKFLFDKIKKEISDFNYQAKKVSFVKISFFQPQKKRNLLMVQKEIIFALKRCKIEYFLCSKGIIVFRPKFSYDFGDDYYSGIEFCKFLLELQFYCNSMFPVSLDITTEAISLLIKYDKNFQKILDDSPWFFYVERLNNIINFFMEENKDKICISRERVWDVLEQIESLKKDNFFFFF